MDLERLKDGAEDATAAMIEGAASMLPILGGPLAVAVNRAFGSAVQRRHERDIAELRSDLETVIAKHEITDAEARLSSERFIAGMYLVSPAIQSTTSAEKRKYLRNALINGTVLGDWGEYRREFFLRQLVGFEALHVHILEFAGSLPRFDPVDMPEDGVWRDLATMALNEFFPGEPEFLAIVQSAVNQLERSDLLTQAQPQTRGLQDAGNGSRPDSISDLGRDFLKFVTDPLAD